MRDELNKRGVDESGSMATLISRLKSTSTPAKRVLDNIAANQTTPTKRTRESAATVETPQSGAKRTSSRRKKNSLSPAVSPLSPLKGILVTTPVIDSATPKRARSSNEAANGDARHSEDSDGDSDDILDLHAGAHTEPRKRTRLSDAARRKSVGFNDVEVREYERRHGGGGGVPYNGAYPLGLGWTVAATHKEQLQDFERRRSGVRHASEALPRVDEHHRKMLLESADQRPALERAASYVAVRRELQSLRDARDAVGCGCRDTGGDGCICSKETHCPCFDNQLECCIETCKCDLALCRNPYKD